MTSTGNAGANDAEGLSYVFGEGMDERCGLWIVFGSQSRQINKSFARSVIMENQRKGHVDPPKVSLSEMYPSWLKVVQLDADEWPHMVKWQ